MPLRSTSQGCRSRDLESCITEEKNRGSEDNKREIVMLCEIRQMEKDTYHTILLICELIKNGANELIYKQK